MNLTYLSNVSTLKLDEEKCTGCRYCIFVCPREVLNFHSRKAHIINIDQCIECGACQLNCDSNAITVQSGVGCSAAIIYSMFTGKEATCGAGSNTSGGCC